MGLGTTVVYESKIHYPEPITPDEKLRALIKEYWNYHDKLLGQCLGFRDFVTQIKHPSEMAAIESIGYVTDKDFISECIKIQSEINFKNAVMMDMVI